MESKNDPLIGFDKVAAIVVDFAWRGAAIIEHQDPDCYPLGIKPIANRVGAKRGEQDMDGIDRVAAA
jgi:hypothetical protein